MAPYVYEYEQAGHVQRLLYAEAWAAVLRAGQDLHEQRATPLRVRQGGRVVYEQARLQRAYALCRADLEAHPLRLPTVLARMAARS